MVDQCFNSQVTGGLERADAGLPRLETPPVGASARVFAVFRAKSKVGKRQSVPCLWPV